MTCTRTATLPVSPDEAFALITEPERLRRWQTVSAVVDLRAGGDFRWTVSPGHVAAGSGSTGCCRPGCRSCRRRSTGSGPMSSTCSSPTRTT